MGAYVSIENDTEDVVYVHLGANTAVLGPIAIAVSAILAIVTAGAALELLPGVVGSIAVLGETIEVTLPTIVGVGAAGLGVAFDAVKKSFTDKMNAQDGWHLVSPGTTYYSDKVSLSLNMRAYVIRFHEDQANAKVSIMAADKSVWSGPTDGSVNNYRVSDPAYFSDWDTKTYDVKVDGTPSSSTIAAAVLERPGGAVGQLATSYVRASLGNESSAAALRQLLDDAVSAGTVKINNPPIEPTS